MSGRLISRREMRDEGESLDDTLDILDLENVKMSD
jgi:hypothetical protein